MKRAATILLLLFIIAINSSAQHLIKGVVLDEFSQPMPNVNIFIKETLEGTSSGTDGSFSFKTEAEGVITLSAMMLGYETWTSKTDVSTFSGQTIKMKPVNLELDGVEIVASNFLLKGSSQWKSMGAVDLVTTGGSNGDLYKSISTLPGTQVAGENGRLFIRGGESRESQTYIDDMHVLSPYTTTGSENTPVRGRYSPFMFEGMSFSLGGYDPEYGQGLSSVLPLSTKDESLITKLGTSVTTVGVGGGGTKSFSEGSASLNIDYQNLSPYYAVVPDRTEWKRPYQRFSGGSQFRYNPSSKTVAKLYVGYDYTSLAFLEDERKLDLKEDNLYVNGTFRHQTGNGYKLFGGAAFSLLNKRTASALVAQDLYQNKEWELHMKMKGEKRYSSFFKWQIGVETMIRDLKDEYTFNLSYKDKVTHSINSAFTTGSFTLSERLTTSISSRVEYTTVNKQWNFLPRLALNYNLNDFYVSAIAGRYAQLTYNDYLLKQPDLPTESCWHYILGGYHQSQGRVYRVEAYYKDYDHLALQTNETFDASGYGYSKGIDFFFDDVSSIKNLEYRLSYSLNYAKRKYRDYPVADVPQYATKHNASLSLRYNCNILNSIIGVTNRFASGRPYHDPNETGWMNKTAPAYNSLDLSWTYLVNPKLIIFASASNILCRKEIFNYTWSDTPDMNGHYKGAPVRSNSDQFFFIGVFITLGGNSAYDVSNF